MTKPDVVLMVDHGADEMAESVGSLLRERYGVFHIGHLAVVAETLTDTEEMDEVSAPRLHVSSTGLRLPDDEGTGSIENLDIALSGFAREHLRMRSDQQSVRSDRAMLEHFRHTSGAINVWKMLTL